MSFWTKTLRALGAAALLALLAVPALAQEPAAADAALTSEDDKTLYALGLFLARNLAVLDLTPGELAIVQDALEDAVLGREPKVDLQVYGPKIQTFAEGRTAAAAAAEKEAAASWVAEAAAMEGAETTASGLVFIPVVEGTGASPTAADTVRVHYHGTLRDGFVFDSSVERGTPAEFPLGGVIACWTEGVQKMKVGGKAKLVCPPDLAYGDRGAGDIPPGSALTFEVELLDIVGGEAPSE